MRFGCRWRVRPCGDVGCAPCRRKIEAFVNHIAARLCLPYFRPSAGHARPKRLHVEHEQSLPVTAMGAGHNGWNGDVGGVGLQSKISVEVSWEKSRWDKPIQP